MAVPLASIPQNHVSKPEDVVSSHVDGSSASNSGASVSHPPRGEPYLCLMIDNYDSFTFNLYQYMCQLGAELLVKRNDEITVVEVESLYKSGVLRSIVISPGPGHPRTDSGVSRELVKWAEGKVPVLGVCMGLEVIVDVYGGDIAYAGEIVHGKTSLVKHDCVGCFHALPPLIPSTRYHSLSAKLMTVPSCLQVTSTTNESGVIMGVRHREYTIEAVQYHPESVMSEGGRELLANFLKLEGGYWGGKNAWCGVPASSSAATSSINGNATKQVRPVVDGVNSKTTQPTPSSVSVPNQPANGQTSKSTAQSGAPALPTILNRIHQQRLLDIAAAEQTPATTPANLTTSIRLHAAPSITPLVARISQTLPAHPAVMAEIKRASPSKGDISVETNAPAQAIKYALAGAGVISVLTEPKWFKGQLSDLLSVRQALASLPNRPALLRKDFIVSRYQIDEARIHGADTVLLIVAMLDVPQLQDLYAYSVSLGMEPLVEVNNGEELNIALDLGAKVIGVNNRNLHDFNVDMQTTSRLADVLKERGRQDVILCALSGITGRADVERYVQEGVKAVLVGESLMRATDPRQFLKELLGLQHNANGIRQSKRVPLVKICGLQSLEDAKLAHQAGADFLGLIFAKSKRQVSMSTALQITTYARTIRASLINEADLAEDATNDPLNPSPWFTSNAQRIQKNDKPLVVGVFQNQPLSYIQRVASAVGLDMVQLHGDEPQEWANHIPVPVVKVFRVGQDKKVVGGQVDRPGLNQYTLLDAAGANGAAGGGEGVAFDWTIAKEIIEAGEVGTESHYPLPVILAGGLTPDNVAHAVSEVQPWCVDVSSGVEAPGNKAKDPAKVSAFIANAKRA